MKAIFKSLKTLIENYLNDEGYLSREDLIARIEQAFEDNDITMKEYAILQELIEPDDYI